MANDWRNAPVPTHRCVVCGAMWRFWRASDTGDDGDSWTLRSAHAGPCCDSVEMRGQIQVLTMGEIADFLRTHQGVDVCEVAAAVEVVRALEVIKTVEGLVGNFHEGPFRAGFETACDEIEHRLKPCEHCDAALAKDGA